MQLKRVLTVLAAAAFVLACGVATPTATPLPPTPLLPTDTPTIASPTLPSGTGPCEVSSDGDVTTYTRPFLEADIFSAGSLASPVPAMSRTADGWIGFEPGKAQAANIGVFRLRWIPPEASVLYSGDCASVPLAAWVPQPGVCYEMVMDTVEVHAAADATSAVNGTLKPGDFAAILGRTASGWVSVSGDQANTPGVNGFIPEEATNVNGPCDSIPTVPG